jgi:hypothetical protein
MAEIYDKHGNEITVGLQSSTVCDAAIQSARGIAADRDEEVFLEDDGSRITVHPDGTTEDGWEGEWD